MIDDYKKDSVWLKHGPNFPEAMFDHCGRMMRYRDYGNRQSQYGWEIDHIIPESKGGTDDLSNLRPVHWMSNLERQASQNNV